MLNTSFPSGHALTAALFFISCALLLSRLLQYIRIQICVFACAVTMTALVGASRVYLGLHWPSDVVAGWASGVGWIATVQLTFARLAQEVGQQPIGQKF